MVWNGHAVSTQFLPKIRNDPETFLQVLKQVGVLHPQQQHVISASILRKNIDDIILINFDEISITRIENQSTVKRITAC